jgi:lipopolysaccharide transport system ATP-binding protein
MGDVAIRADSLSKQYRIGSNRSGYRTLRDTLTDALAAPFRRGRRLFRGQPYGAAEMNEMIWALKDVSFEIKRGEVVGIIGSNGAGKTTLLKILSRITEPTEGYAEIHGRVGSLLEVGTGFHPELTGRENIYLNGAILGMKKAEIVNKFEEIMDFAQIEKFIDTPVKHYSSGMYVRLAFAVAAHLEPEILLVDEVLAVGDAQFQRKCLGKMDEVATAGRTVLFVSHNLAAVENLCKRVLLVDKGKVAMSGDAYTVVNRYLQQVTSSAEKDISLVEHKDRSGDGRIRLISFHLEDIEGNKVSVARSGMDVVFAFGFQCQEGETPRNVDIGFSIHSERDQTLFVLYSSYTGQVFDKLPTVGIFRCHIPNLPLHSGRYRVGARVTIGQEEADWPRGGVGHLEVAEGDFYGTGNKGFARSAPFLVSGKWTLTDDFVPFIQGES